MKFHFGERFDVWPDPLDDWGYSQLGLDADALARAIKAVGNYGEIYDRYMGPNGIAFTLPRGPNAHWTDGGLIYAPPIK